LRLRSRNIHDHPNLRSHLEFPQAAEDHQPNLVDHQQLRSGVEFINVEGVGLGLEPDEEILQRALGTANRVELSAAA
jgi:hypothetical protein